VIPASGSAPARGAWLFTLRLALCLAATVPPAWMAVRVLPAGRAVDRLVRRWSRLIVRLSGCRPRVLGCPPSDGPVVFASSHSSYLDSVVLMASMPADFRFVAHREALAWPVIGVALRKAGHIIVDRRSAASRRACYRQMRQTLLAGRSVLVFPEGTIRAHDEPGRLHAGAFRAAATTGCPLVPVVFRGTRQILPRPFRLPRRSPIDVHVYPAVAVASRTPPDVDRARREVAGLMSVAPAAALAGPAD